MTAFQKFLDTFPSPKDKEKLQEWAARGLERLTQKPKSIQSYQVSIANKHEDPTYVKVQARNEQEAERIALLMPEIKEKYRDTWHPLVSCRAI